MNLLYALALFFSLEYFVRTKPAKNFSIKNQTHHVFGFQSGNQNERPLGIAGSNGDDETFDMKPPVGFPFVINGPKYLELPSAFWAAQREIDKFASQLPSPGEHKELEENTIVLDDFAFLGQLINEVSFIHFTFTLGFKFATF